MTPAEFLTAVWPSSGFYVLATPFTPPGEEKPVYGHRTFDNISDVVSFVETRRDKQDIFFGVHSLRERRVFNPKKIDRKTGQPGAYEIRVQTNSLAAKCFFFDIDIGVSTARVQKYPTQAEGLRALREFCSQTKLPRPMVVSSGSGLHVYWLLKTDLTSDEWRVHAAKLRALALHYKLLVDPARTTDSASVLRVVGTYNFKDRAAPRAVQVLMTGTPSDGFLDRLSAAAIRADVHDVRLPPKAPDDGWGPSNLSTAPSGPPPSLRSVLAACEVMRDVVRAQGNVSEPEWYHTLNLVRFLENGKKLVHKVSQGHPNYDPDQTDAKVAQLEAKDVAPTSCLKLAEVTGSTACTRCPFQGKVKSPIVAARYKDPAPPPLLVASTGAAPVQAIPDPPFPFIRLKDGAIAHQTKNKEGDEITQVIFDHDLYPLQRMASSEEKKEEHVWRVNLPIVGPTDFTLPAEALYDRQKFVSHLANCGVFPRHGNIPPLMDYMVAYIQELQRITAASAQNNHLGWNPAFDGFILPEKTYMVDGSVKASTLGGNAALVGSDMGKKGTLERQVELLRFFNHPAYAAHQFLILGSLAAPIFWATGLSGAIVNASGDSGAGKSTALYTAASFWGPPEKFALNGTELGATAKYKESRITTMSNLPMCVDEITMMEAKAAKNMAMSISQPGTRRGLKSDRTERKVPENSKATLMLCTANSSLHDLISQENASGSAGAMRVFEIITYSTGVHTKAQADDFWHDLRQNYGWIGEAFMAWVAPNQQLVEDRVREKVRQVDIQMATHTSERFWSAAIAAVVVAGEIARELGLLTFDTAHLQSWAVTHQVNNLRGIVKAEYLTSTSVLQDYIAQIQGNILTTTQARGFGSDTQDTVLNASRPNQLLGHYDQTLQTMWLLRKGFKDYCAKQGVNCMRAIDEMSTAKVGTDDILRRVIKDKMVKKTLGSRTQYAKGQAWCFAVDMTHPEMTGTEKSLVSNVTALVRENS